MDVYPRRRTVWAWRGGAAIRRGGSGYPFGDPIESGGKIRLPLWGSKEKVLADVGRCYSVG
jgi:hypothetical protein